MVVELQRTPLSKAPSPILVCTRYQSGDAVLSRLSGVAAQLRMALSPSSEALKEFTGNGCTT